MRFRHANAAVPEVIRHLGHFLRKRYGEETVKWLGKAGTYDAGCFEPGGPRMQGLLTCEASGVIANELAVIEAERLAQRERG